MKFLIAMCLLAGVNAQWGESGVVHADGTLQQFTREEADNIADIGESGVVMKDGTHVQFSYDDAAHHNNLPAAPMPVATMLESHTGPYGYTGIVMPEGDNVQFNDAQAGRIVLIGPSGVVHEDGVNMQFNDDGYPVRKRREVALEGPSGVQFMDGQLRHLPVGVSIAVMSESGAVLTNGDNVQFRKKRDTHGATVGPSGLITPSGRLIQLAPGVSVVSAGPSAALLSTGEGIQYDRKKRSAARDDVDIGESGIITPGGRQIQLPHGVSVVLMGPSAALLSDGTSVQYEF